MPGLAPKATVAAPVKNVPITVTGLPPAKGPELGSTAATLVWGAAMVVVAMWWPGLYRPGGREDVPAQCHCQRQPALVAAVTVTGRPVAGAVKLRFGPLALSLVPRPGVGIWVVGTVMVVVWAAGVAPQADTEVLYVPEMLFPAGHPGQGAPAG